MDAPERRDRRIDPRQLHRDKAVQQPAAAGRAISFVAYPADADVGHLRNDLEGKFVARPIVFDHRRDHAFRERTHAFDQRAFPLIENVRDPVEITIDWRRRVSRLLGHRDCGLAIYSSLFSARLLRLFFFGVSHYRPRSWMCAA